MFGGIGLYQDQRFFGIITSDTFYFKVNDANRGDYRARGMGRQISGCRRHSDQTSAQSQKAGVNDA
jgi:TfoX/Sxy family transcriptional regulator of competence genes